MPTNFPPHNHPLLRRLMGQSALLFSGYAIAQLMAFARNALLGHLLAKGDFGIAATLTLMLQLLEMTSDIGADRLILQAKDGDGPHLVATAHAMLIGRGLLTALVLYLAAGPVTRFFNIEEARAAFEWMALAPLIKGFMHLDVRRAQRRLDNRPQMTVEILPQAAALLLTLPAIAATGNYSAIVWLSIAQSIIALAASHALAERRYEVALDRHVAMRQFEFGWPILLSALPLIAVYQGDRILIGRTFGMEALAGYTAAFMITMIPGLFAAKIGQALMLPTFSEVQDNHVAFRARYAAMCEVTALATALYLALFIIAGGEILPIAFGGNYAGLGTIVAWLALMWSMRMVQAVPGMALMAIGETKPFLAAGLIRASALGLALAATFAGAGIAVIAATGAAGEFASLIYVARRVSQDRPDFGKILLSRSLLIIPAGIGAMAFSLAMPAGSGLAGALPAVLLATACLVAAAAATMPRLKALLGSIHARSLQATLSRAAPGPG